MLLLNPPLQFASKKSVKNNFNFGIVGPGPPHTSLWWKHLFVSSPQLLIEWTLFLYQIFVVCHFIKLVDPVNKSFHSKLKINSSISLSFICWKFSIIFFPSLSLFPCHSKEIVPWRLLRNKEIKTKWIAFNIVKRYHGRFWNLLKHLS